MRDGLTIDDFEELPDALARNHELVDGELIDVSGNIAEHILFCNLLLKLLGGVVEQHHLGIVLPEMEFDFGGNAHGPDVSFISEAQRPFLDRKRRVQRFVPDMAIEVVSARDTFQELIAKVLRYRRCGTREVWLFDLVNRLVFLYSETRRAILDENDEFRPECIPGFAMRIADLFDQC